MKVNGYDLFFSGKESSVKKLMNILESTIVYETITYNMIGNTEMKDKHPIYFHDEYVITIMFDEPKLFTAEMNIKMFSVNNFLMNLLIEEHKLKNIEYLEK